MFGIVSNFRTRGTDKYKYIIYYKTCSNDPRAIVGDSLEDLVNKVQEVSNSFINTRDSMCNCPQIREKN